MKKLWRDYNLSIVLAALFLAAWAGQTYSGWVRFRADQETHGRGAQVWGADGYLYDWLEATLENWQSEWLQLLTFVILTAYLVHKGSHESKDTDEEMQEALRRIEEKLDDLTEKGDTLAP
jgi:hypothetical protein